MKDFEKNLNKAVIHFIIGFSYLIESKEEFIEKFKKEAKKIRDHLIIVISDIITWREKIIK